MRKKEAISTMLEVLPKDRVCIFRNSIIQAIELISSRDAIPALQAVENKDSLREYRLRAKKTFN